MKKIIFFTVLFFCIQILTAQNVGIGTNTPQGKLNIKGNTDISQLVIDANTSQSNLQPLIRLRNAAGIDMMHIHSDDSTNVFVGYRAGKSNLFNPGSNGINNTFMGFKSGFSNTTGWSNDAFGFNTLYSNTIGWGNNAFGFNALFTNTSGTRNSAFGYHALLSNTGGHRNSAFGPHALSDNTTGSENTAIGLSALTTNTTGSYNTASGKYALYYNTGGNYNTANGEGALFFNYTGDYNTASGSGALSNNGTGSNNTAVGHDALLHNLHGSNATAVGARSMYYANNTSVAYNNQNVAVGYEALRGSTSFASNTGNYNTATGYQTLFNNSSGGSNTAMGQHSLEDNMTGNSNSAVGRFTLQANLSGDGNVAVGYSAGSARNAGSYCTYIGYDADNLSGTDYDNSTAIGYLSRITAANQVKLGNSNITSFYCLGAYAATTANAANMYVSSTGQIMRSTSSARYKKDISDLKINSNLIYQLRPVSYSSITDNGKHFGLIAEEVAATIPELAEYAKEKDVIKESNSDRLIPDAVQYPLLSVLLLKEMQEQKKIIEMLVKKIEMLEQKHSKN